MVEAGGGGETGHLGVLGGGVVAVPPEGRACCGASVS